MQIRLRSPVVRRMFLTLVPLVFFRHLLVIRLIRSLDICAIGIREFQAELLDELNQLAPVIEVEFSSN